MLNEDIVLSYGFVDDKTCTEIETFIRNSRITHPHLFEDAQPGGATLLKMPNVEKIDQEIYNKVILIKNKINDYINYYYKSTFSPNGFYLQEWTPGSHHPAHNENAPKHLQKQISTLTYLNDDFIGGDLLFNVKNVKPQIKKGLMTFFCGQYHQNTHTVSKIIHNNRYTLVIFWSDDNDFPEYKV